MGLIICAPFFLQVGQVKERAIDWLSMKLNCQIKVGSVKWDWLPFPYLFVENARITDNRLEIFLPEIGFYPSWTVIFDRNSEIGKISLSKPGIHIKSITRNTGDPDRFRLPRATIVIRDGSIKIDSAVDPPQFLKAGLLSFSSIDSEIKTHANGVEFDAGSLSPFCENIKIQGRYAIPQQTYHIDITCPALKFDNTITSLTNGQILPLESEANVTGYIEGDGLDTIKAGLKGGLPCFIVKSNDKQMMFDCRTADLSLEKSGPEISVLINRLELKEPGLILNGCIKKYTPSIKTFDGRPAESPGWLIDLEAENLDVSAIRNGVLTLWANNEIAMLVCDIVRGGRANSARFYFNGPVSELKNINAMTVDVDVQRASLHIPVADLFLDKARGTIQIKEGFLTGLGLSAGLDDSFGENCSLLVALNENDQDFKLDLDFDADLKALPLVLDRLVDQHGFRNELHRFTDVRGRARGHLAMGDMLDDLDVEVEVTEMKADASYDRVPWPVRIHGGQLNVSSNRVDWQNVKAAAGPYIINGKGGEVSWENDPFLFIDLDRTEVESGSLNTGLTFNAIAPRRIFDTSSATEGPVEIKKLSLEINGESATIQGKASRVEHGLDLDINLKSAALSKDNLDRIISNFRAEKEKIEDDDGRLPEGRSINIPWDITGIIGFDLDSFIWKRQKTGAGDTRAPVQFTWQPMRGMMNLYPHGEIALEITSANLCSIAMTGLLHFDSELKYELGIGSDPSVVYQFQQVLPCLGIKQSLVQGDFTIDATLKGKDGKWTSGKAAVYSKRGRILKMELLSKIFRVVNITDLFSSSDMPDLSGKGFPYSKMDLKTHVENNKLIIDKAVIRGEGLNLFAKGEIELDGFQCDLTVLIAPFKTIDNIMAGLPIVGQVIGGDNPTLVTIPVSVKGPANDPEITFAGPGDIDGPFLWLVKDALKLPFYILNPGGPDNR
ncbi:MAG: AsmA-like C-terminal domain-containing protein [Thermodesulfobacteriota bacterium]|nr:AsmA-like C-terminal domain-containing protein [Thermodesulfobacteriota bacterium]